MVSYDISYGAYLYLYKLNESVNIIPIAQPSPDSNSTITITPILPANIIINSTTGVITSTNSTTSQDISKGPYRITVKDTFNTERAHTIIQIIIDFEPVFNYSANAITYTLDYLPIERISPRIYINKTIPVFFYDITIGSNNLVSLGLNIDNLSGDINGTFNKSGIFGITTQSNNNGITYIQVITFTVLEKPSIPNYDNNFKSNVIFDSGKNVFVFAQGENCRISPQQQLGITYSIDGCTNLTNYVLPKGLNFNTTTGVISGIPLVYSTYRKYKITVYNSNGYSENTYIYITSIPSGQLVTVVSSNVSEPLYQYDSDNVNKLDMRRKIEIFKYKKNGIMYTQVQQTSIFNNRQPHINNKICPRRQPYVASSTSACGVPGKPMLLFYDPDVRLYKFSQIGYTPNNIS